MWLHNLKDLESLHIPKEELIPNVITEEKPIIHGFPKETQWVVLKNKFSFNSTILLLVTLLGDSGVTFNDSYVDCAVEVDGFVAWMSRNEKNKGRVIDGLKSAANIIASQLSQEQNVNSAEV